MAQFPITTRPIADLELSGNFLIATDGVSVTVGKISLGQTGTIALVPVVFICDLRRNGGEELVKRVHWNPNAPGNFVAVYASGFEVVDVVTAKTTISPAAPAPDAEIPAIFRAAVCRAELRRLSLGGAGAETESATTGAGGGTVGTSATLLKLLRRQETPKKTGSVSWPVEKFPIVALSPCGRQLAFAHRGGREISVFSCSREEGVSQRLKFSTSDHAISDFVFIEPSQIFVAGQSGEAAFFEEGRLIKLLKFPVETKFPSVTYMHDTDKNILVFAGVSIANYADSGESFFGVFVFEGSRVHIFRSEEEISDLIGVVKVERTPEQDEPVLQVYFRAGVMGNLVAEISAGRFIAEPCSPVYSAEHGQDMEEISDRSPIMDDATLQVEEASASGALSSSDEVTQLDRLEKLLGFAGERNFATNFRSQLTASFAQIAREKVFPSLHAVVKEIERNLHEQTTKETNKAIGNVTKLQTKVTKTIDRAKELEQAMRNQKTEIDQLLKNFRAQKTEVGNLFKLKLAEVVQEQRGKRRTEEISDVVSVSNLSVRGSVTGERAPDALAAAARDFLRHGNRAALIDICTEIMAMKSRGVLIPITPLSRLDEAYLVLYSLVQILASATTSQAAFQAVLRVCHFQVDCVRISGPPGTPETREVVETSHSEVMAVLQRIPAADAETWELKNAILRKLDNLTPRFRRST